MYCSPLQSIPLASCAHICPAGWHAPSSVRNAASLCSPGSLSGLAVIVGSAPKPSPHSSSPTRKGHHDAAMELQRLVSTGSDIVCFI